MLPILLLAPLTLEVAAGGSSTLRNDVPIAPVVALSVAEEWAAAAAGIRAFGIFGSEGYWNADHPERGERSGYRAWGVLAEVEGHAHALPTRAFVRLGAGIGKLLGAYTGPSYYPPLIGKIAPVLRASVGIRTSPAKDFWLGIERRCAGVHQRRLRLHGILPPSTNTARRRGGTGAADVRVVATLAS